MTAANENAPHYRDGTAAGFKGNCAITRENGREAAEKVTKSLGPRHQQMIAAWARYGAVGAIPEQVSADIDLDVRCVRPRASELRKRGLLFVVGKRLGGMGSKVTAYSVVKPAEEQTA